MEGHMANERIPRQDEGQTVEPQSDEELLEDLDAGDEAEKIAGGYLPGNTRP